jgi:hypothetical protein
MAGSWVPTLPVIGTAIGSVVGVLAIMVIDDLWPLRHYGLSDRRILLIGTAVGALATGMLVESFYD